MVRNFVENRFYVCPFPIIQRLIKYFVSEHLFELKFAAKQLEKNAQRCDKQEKVEKDKLTAAIKVGRVIME